MDPIYVTGHRNPDTDSIVSAMAYAALRNAIGDGEYTAACLGRVSDETQLVLDRFGFEPPVRIHNMHTQVRDLEYDRPPMLSTGVTVSRGWDVLRGQKHLSAIPVVNEDGTLYGMLSRENVASYNMSLVSGAYLKPVPLFNILSVIEGKVLNDAGESVDLLHGEITVGLPQIRDSMLFQNKDTILLCGNQPELIERALRENITCVLLCQAELPESLRATPTETCIISTPLDAYRALRLIFLSVSIGSICRTEDIVCFHLDDRLDEVKERVLEFRESCYPILDENERVAGVLTRYHLLRPRRKRVVLVDHNEIAQSVRGLEETDILEIIDHHRLADIQTGNPIYMRNEPVGATSTIIAGMFQERGLMPSPKMAGMLAAAIVSDTVMFKSPTCTDRDIRTAERMARIANVSLEDLGRDIFSASVGNKSASELLQADYKEFHIAGHDLAISQITCMDSPEFLKRKDEFLKLMEELAKQKGLSMVILLLTDVLLEGSQLIYVGSDEIIEQAFGVTPKGNVVFLPSVMSRKKQVIPMLSALWG